MEQSSAKPVSVSWSTPSGEPMQLAAQLGIGLSIGAIVSIAVLAVLLRCLDQRHRVEMVAAVAAAAPATEDEVESSKVAALQSLMASYAWTPPAQKSCDADVSVHTGGEAECCLCLETYVPGAVVVRLRCGHVFHLVCSERWLIVSQAFRQRTCPLCKADPLSREIGREPADPRWRVNAPSPISREPSAEFAREPAPVREPLADLAMQQLAPAGLERGSPEGPLPGSREGPAQARVDATPPAAAEAVGAARPRSGRVGVRIGRC